MSAKGFTPLHAAVNNGWYNICKLILENVGDNNPAVNGGFLLLSIAALNGRFEIMKLIIENMLEKDIADIEGKTSLLKAILKGNLYFSFMIIKYTPKLTLIMTFSCLLFYFVIPYWLEYISTF